VSTEVDNVSSEAPIAGVARTLGVRLLKLWAGVYAVVLCAYAVHRLTGFDVVAIQQLRVGQRVWAQVAVEDASGRLELDPGQTISPTSLGRLCDGAIVQGGFTQTEGRWQPTGGPDTGAPEAIRLYRQGVLHRLPWAALLGLLNFLGLAILLYTLLGDVVPAYVGGCVESVRAELDTAQEAVAKAEELAEKDRMLTEELDAERARTEARVGQDAEAEREYLIAEARKNAARIIDSFKHHLDSELQAAVAELRADIASQLVDEVRGEFKQQSDGHIHDHMVASFVEQLRDVKLT